MATAFQRQAGKVKVIILVAVVVLIVLAGGTTAALYFGGVIGHSAPAAEGDQAAEQPAAEDKAKKDEAKAPPKYLALDPPLVVNFERQGGVGFLQVTMQVMARKQEALDAVQDNMPMIRNNLLLLLGSQTYETVSTRDGKEKLREEAKEEVNKVLAKVGSEDKIEAVYFTGFVMQ